jgi:hypothetical protein
MTSGENDIFAVDSCVKKDKEMQAKRTSEKRE